MKKMRLAMFWTVFGISDRLLACAVCFGDPHSSMTIGAKAGVAFLLGVVTLVLGSFVTVAIYWMKRAKILEVQKLLHKDFEQKI